MFSMSVIFSSLKTEQMLMLGTEEVSREVKSKDLDSMSKCSRMSRPEQGCVSAALYDWDF